MGATSLATQRVLRPPAGCCPAKVQYLIWEVHYRQLDTGNLNTCQRYMHMMSPIRPKSVRDTSPCTCSMKIRYMYMYTCTYEYKRVRVVVKTSPNMNFVHEYIYV
jgi:hypothetical protein